MMLWFVLQPQFDLTLKTSTRHVGNRISESKTELEKVSLVRPADSSHPVVCTESRQLKCCNNTVAGFCIKFLTPRENNEHFMWTFSCLKKITRKKTPKRC